MTFRRTASPASVLEVPATGAPAISFILVTFGTWPSVIDDCLRRLVASVVFGDVPAEFIVIDNFHPVVGNACGHHLAMTTSGIRLATLRCNLGFGGGNEVGIAAARAETICLVNPDLLVHDGWLTPLLADLVEHPGDVIAPRLLDVHGELDEAGQLIGSDGNTSPAPEGVEVDYASAACWLMKASTHERVGGFDPRFHPAYYEDVDYSLRLRRLGNRIRVHPTVAVTHLRGGSIGSCRAIADVSAQLTVFKDLWQSELWRQPSLPAR